MARDLERQVFGGSESELSSDEDDLDNRKQSPSPPPPSRRERDSSPGEGEDAREVEGARRGGASRSASESGDGDGSEDEYAPAGGASGLTGGASGGGGGGGGGKGPGAGKAKKKKTQKRVRVVDGEEGGDADAEGAGGGKTKKRKREKRTMKKREERTLTEEDLSEMPPEQASKLRLDMKLSSILKPPKRAKSRKSRSGAGEHDLDSFADDTIARLREAMNAAADADIKANSQRQPALSKLRMLPEVVDILRRGALAQSIIDNNLLEAVRRFLEPLPDKSLPALNIQKEIFGLLPKMEYIDSSVLKESGLGRVVLFYAKCGRVERGVGRVAGGLVSAWSRPIIKRSASFRDRVVPMAGDGYGLGSSTGGVGQSQMQGGLGQGGSQPLPSLSQILSHPPKNARPGSSKHVSVPQRSLGSYTVAPKDLGGMSVLARMSGGVVARDVERRRVNAERMRRLGRRVKD